MNAVLEKLKFVVPLLALLASSEPARAWYDPGVQRWINRDPISERGFYFSARPEFEYLHGWTRDYIFVAN
jgi:hypothetical protein